MKFEQAQSMMSLYLHFVPPMKSIDDQIDTSIDFSRTHAPYTRRVAGNSSKRPVEMSMEPVIH